MAFIGSPQGIDLPVPGDGGDDDVTAAAKIVAAFETLIGAVEGQVPASAVLWNSNVSLGSYALTNVLYMHLQSGSLKNFPGYLQNVDGNLTWVHPDGAIQLTVGDAINVASTGVIDGDYGGADPARVTYVDATSIYEFTTDPGVYADIKVDEVILDSGSGTTKLASSSSGADTWTFPDLPASTLLLQVSAAGVIDASNDVAEPVTFSGAVALDAGATLAAGQTLKHGDRMQRIGLNELIFSSGAGSLVYVLGGFLATGGSCVYEFSLPVEIGTRVTSIRIRVNKADTSSTSLIFKKRTDSGAVLTIDSEASTTSGFQTITMALASPEIINDDITKRWYCSVSFAEGDYITAIEFSYDRV